MMISSMGEPWYARQPSWRLPLESAARRQYGAELRSSLTGDTLVYELDDLDVTGRFDEIPLRITFLRPKTSCLDPTGYQWTRRIPASDYPTVHADIHQQSPHRLAGGALCLYHPEDPPWRRWRSEDGLLALIDLSRDHVFMETYWRATRQWLTEEAPHGARTAA